MRRQRSSVFVPIDETDYDGLLSMSMSKRKALHIDGREDTRKRWYEKH